MALNPDGHEIEVITGRRSGTGASRQGEANPNAALKDSEAREVRILRSNGWSHQDIAVLYGISVGRSSEICRGRAYAGAGGPVESGREYHIAAARYTGDAAVLERSVLDLHGRGLSQRAIASRVQRSKTLVGDIIRASRREAAGA
jgi:hypothetical protein